MNRTVYIVRHCEASGQEPAAPLTAKGAMQASGLARFLAGRGIQRIVASPFVRAVQTAQPLAHRLNLPIETEAGLKERVLSARPLDDWRVRMEETFTDLDLQFEGGETSRAAMHRVATVVEEYLKQEATVTVLITHGNLMTLLLKHFDEAIGFSDWERLTNPDVYCLEYGTARSRMERILTQAILAEINAAASG